MKDDGPRPFFGRLGRTWAFAQADRETTARGRRPEHRQGRARYFIGSDRVDGHSRDHICRRQRSIRSALRLPLHHPAALESTVEAAGPESSLPAARPGQAPPAPPPIDRRSGARTSTSAGIAETARGGLERIACAGETASRHQAVERDGRRAAAASYFWTSGCRKRWTSGPTRRRRTGTL